MNLNRREGFGLVDLVLIFSAIAVTSCGHAPSEVAPTTQTNSQRCITNEKWPTPPSVEQLTTMLHRVLDPNVPLADKKSYVQGADDDPQLLNRLAAEAERSKFSAKILRVTDSCNGTASAATLVTFDTRTNGVDVPLVAENGTWKLDKEWMCGMMSDYQLTSRIYQ